MFWNDRSNKVARDEDAHGHAIIIIGAQSIQHGDETQHYVFYLDPNDGSVPGEERTMYRVEYEILEKRLYQQNGIQLTSPEHASADSVYAIAGR